MNDLNGGTKTVRLSSCAAVSVGSSCLAGWRRHVLLWVQLLWSDVVVADIGSDVKRLGVCAEAMADRMDKQQFTVRSSVVSFDARLDADVVHRSGYYVLFFGRRMLIPFLSLLTASRHKLQKVKVKVWTLAIAPLT